MDVDIEDCRAIQSLRAVSIVFHINRLGHNNLRTGLRVTCVEWNFRRKVVFDTIDCDRAVALII